MPYGSDTAQAGLQSTHPIKYPKGAKPKKSRPAPNAKERACGEATRPVTTPLTFPNQHFNSITSWAVDSTGAIKHVYA